MKNRWPSSCLAPARVCKLLRRIGCSKHYDHATIITMILNPNYKPIEIDPIHEEYLCSDFMEVTPVFEKIKSLVRKGRRNFMSYPTLASKLCERRDYTQYLPLFQLLKSQHLRVEQDNYFRLICAELGWEQMRSEGNITLPKY